VNGTLAPGSNVGALTFNGNLALAGSSRIQFEISRNPLTNHQVIVFGHLIRGGRLEVFNTSIEPLEVGDHFNSSTLRIYREVLCLTVCPRWMRA
jgi:hypothetical protein